MTNNYWILSLFKLAHLEFQKKLAYLVTTKKEKHIYSISHTSSNYDDKGKRLISITYFCLKEAI